MGSRPAWAARGIFGRMDELPSTGPDLRPRAAGPRESEPTTGSAAPRAGDQSPAAGAFAEWVRAGDESAFESLFRAHYAALCDYADSIVASRAVAEELVQNVFLAVWAQRERWAPRESERAYLYGAVRNQALNHLEHRRVERRWREAAAREAVADVSAATLAPDPAEAEEMTARVREAIAQLPERARQVVVLRWQHQLRYAEIAAALGISVKGVEVQLARAMRALRERLGDLIP